MIKTQFIGWYLEQVVQSVQKTLAFFDTALGF